MDPKVGDRIFCTLQGFFGVIAHITEIVSKPNQPSLYIMDNGQWLTINEFNIAN